MTVEIDKHKKFQNFAVDRVNRFKNGMLFIANLSDSRYDYSETEVLYYFKELKCRIEAVKEEFWNHKIKRSTLVIEEINEMPKARRSHCDDPMNEKFHKLMVIRLNRIVKILNLLLNFFKCCFL